MQLARDTARALSKLTGDPYGTRAMDEVRAGELLVEEHLGNPAAYAHLVIDSYVQATGDLLHGTGEISRPRLNLAFSSAAVARSACEYAGIGWWLAEPEITITRRIQRTAHVLVRSLEDAKGLLDSQDLAQYEADNALRLNWAKRNQSAREKLPNVTARFTLMNRELGKRHFTYLSLLAHGDLNLTVGFVQAKLGREPELRHDPLWRILLACGYGLTLAARISELRERPSEYPALFERLTSYASLLGE